MAEKLFTNCDSYPGGTGWQEFLNGVGSDVVLETTTKIGGTGSWKHFAVTGTSNCAQTYWNDIAWSATTLARAYVYFPSTPGAEIKFLVASTSNGNSLARLFLYDDSGTWKLRIQNATTGTYYLASVAFPGFAKWVEIRVKVVVNDTTGVLQVWQNGQLVINQSSLDTTPTSYAGNNRWHFGLIDNGGSAVDETVYIDEIYVRDDDFPTNPGAVTLTVGATLTAYGKLQSNLSGKAGFSVGATISVSAYQMFRRDAALSVGATLSAVARRVNYAQILLTAGGTITCSYQYKITVRSPLTVGATLTISTKYKGIGKAAFLSMAILACTGGIPTEKGVAALISEAIVGIFGACFFRGDTSLSIQTILTATARGLSFGNIYLLSESTLTCFAYTHIYGLVSLCGHAGLTVTPRIRHIVLYEQNLVGISTEHVFYFDKEIHLS